MKSFPIILLLLSAFVSNAQQLIVKYERRANIENQLRNVTDPEIRKSVTAYLSKPVKYTLYFDDGVSFYVQENQPDKSKDDELSFDNKKAKRIDIGKKDGGIYKNHVENTYLREANLLGKAFFINDKLEPIDWTLTSETKTIGEYECIKATATVNGKLTEAWYTTAIPVSDGPDDYWGLPGLIIEVITDKLTYHAITVSFKAYEFKFTKPSKGTKVSKKEFLKIREEKINQLRSGSGNQLKIGG